MIYWKDFKTHKPKDEQECFLKTEYGYLCGVYVIEHDCFVTTNLRKEKIIPISWVDFGEFDTELFNFIQDQIL